MGEAVETLLALQHSSKCFDVPHGEIRALQLRAANERFQEQRSRIKLLRLRADDGGVRELRELADLVPLLFPHSAYKSYPERLLRERQWSGLTKWLATLSAFPLDDVDLVGIENLDQWIERLQRNGHHVSCSSGTTGKSAMLVASRRDLDRAGRSSVLACVWATKARPAKDRQVFSLAPVASVPRNHAVLGAQRETFGKAGSDLFLYPVPPITIGAITRMVSLRKAIAEGVALPAQIAEYQCTRAEREQAFDRAIPLVVEALIASREEKLFLTGMWSSLYKVATALRERGFNGHDFRPENLMFVGGGLKGAQLSPDYQNFVRDTFNVSSRGICQIYGMQEIGCNMPRCAKGRYHLPPTLICLPLNREGEALLVTDNGPVEGRAAFFDVSLEARWGGVISGDRIEVDFAPCACGAGSPSIADNIQRFIDLEGDDKISCAGTIDAYVRGLT